MPADLESVKFVKNIGYTILIFKIKSTIIYDLYIIILII